MITTGHSPGRARRFNPSKQRIGNRTPRFALSSKAYRRAHRFDCELSLAQNARARLIDHVVHPRRGFSNLAAIPSTQTEAISHMAVLIGVNVSAEPAGIGHPGFHRGRRGELQPSRGSGWYVRDSPKPGKALRHYPRRNSILANGELTAREAERVVWDVIVVGTGMGGGMLGYSLAPSGRRVLFGEKARSTLPGVPGTTRSSMPEMADPQTPPRGRSLVHPGSGEVASDQVEVQRSHAAIGHGQTAPISDASAGLSLDARRRRQ
ncbi:hypothetical protein [Mycobacterium sp. MFM001]|uniref:hypothetical protein n=1 Tax=Mycobacterium sp. MFM001 TaxID=2049453 RepID=UPI001EDFFB9D|nr:hypothetical protein [Mycobacterium sp. MFM001]